MHATGAPEELSYEEPVHAEGLRDHLIEDHGRAPHEITGLPLTAVHQLEHFDDSLGLLKLEHRHSPRRDLD